MNAGVGIVPWGVDISANLARLPAAFFWILNIPSKKPQRHQDHQDPKEISLFYSFLTWYLGALVVNRNGTFYHKVS
jgi:hypothetical protein